MIHLELERWATGELGAAAWDGAVSHARLEGRRWEADAAYDDADILALVMGLARATGAGPQALLERFGEALAPTLLSAYAHLIPAGWRTLELIENTEDVIHTALRRDDENASPPLLRTTRRGPDEVLLIYGSGRRMCGFAKGLARGIGAAYGDDIVVTEEQCMLAGDAMCDISIRTAP